MIERLLKSQVTQRLLAYPAAVIVGPRQCGKTTLARALGGRYFDLEQPGDCASLDVQWNDLVQDRELIILDEAQSMPAIFPRLRGAIDSDRRRFGRFLLLGSVSPGLMNEVSESLAGRLSIIEMSPFIWEELPESSRDSLWLRGGYPDGGILSPTAFPRWQLDYLTLLAQRDLPNWGLPAKPQTTTRFLRMLAAVHGQAWNASQIASSLGLDYKTINTYLDFLVNSFLIRRLQPYQVNIGKRLSKTPKVYWRDTGLLHAIMNVDSQEILLKQPWAGASWEGFVIEQTILTLQAAGKRFEPHFLRTSDQKELDLVLDFAGKLWAIEIKLTSMPSNGDVEQLNRAADLISASRRFLVSFTKQTIIGGNCMSSGLDAFLEALLRS